LRRAVPKYHHLIRSALGRIRARSFTEADVLALLTLAREQATPRSAMRELGDFAAHRRRERGLFAEYLRETHRELIEGRELAGDLLTEQDFDEGLLSENRIFSVSALEGELGSLADRVGQDRLSSDLVEIVALMVVSLLQGVVFLDGREEVGAVQAVVTHSDIGAVAMLNVPAKGMFVPLIAVPNRWYRVPVADRAFVGFLPDEELEVECQGNQVVLRGLQQ
jgi:hypothetical protein